MVQYKEDGELRGAKVTFRKVPGLSVEWMSQNVRCHQARAAVLGFDEKFLPYSPLTVKGAAVSVSESTDGIVVTIRSSDPIAAATIYGRAEASPHYDHDPDKAHEHEMH